MLKKLIFSYLGDEAMSKFLYSTHLRHARASADTYLYRLETGLSRDEVAELRSISLTVNLAQIDAAHYGWLSLHADCNIDNAVDALEPPGLIFHAMLRSSDAELHRQLRQDWQVVPFEVPGDILLMVYQDDAFVYVDCDIYYTKRRVDRNYIANLMQLYGLSENVRANIEESGPKSPFADA